MIKSFKELSELETFEERFNYLKLESSVGIPTFGFERTLNQQFYRSNEWKKVRDKVIVRDKGCDLGIDGREIFGSAYIHHINPINPADIANRNFSVLLDMDNLVTVSFQTHQAIHFGDQNTLQSLPTDRSPGDTCPWKG